MSLLETTIETTLTGAPAWVETLIALVIGLIGPKLAKYGVAVVKKPAAKAAPLIALALLLTGCACAVQKEAIAASVNKLEPVIHDLETRAGATESERLANQKQIDALKEAAK